MTCKHSEICHLVGNMTYNGESFCILHWPSVVKETGPFSDALERYVGSGKADLSFFYFPKELETSLEGKTFHSTLVLLNTIFPSGDVNLRRTILESGCNILYLDTCSIDLGEATVKGPATIFSKGKISIIELNKASFFEDLNITSHEIDALHGKETTVKGATKITCDKVPNVNFTASDFKKIEMTVKELQALYFLNATLREECEIICARSLGNLTGVNMSSKKYFAVDARDAGTLSFNGAEISGVLRLRAPHINYLTFDRTRFCESIVDLDNVVIAHRLEITGRPSAPNSVSLSGTEVQEDVTLMADFASPTMTVTAESHRPRFPKGKPTYLSNVDLSTCRLVGNNFNEIKFDNVVWNTLKGRKVLYDEIALRQGAAIPLGTLKETYQILKERYKQNGDHATSGDFHYGEMEIKRREYGWPRSILSLEFIYWLSSGYGIGYFRAFVLLLLILLGFATYYYVAGGTPLQDSFQRSLLFSIKVGTLQRPPLPYGFPLTAEWAYICESILVPVQAALFVLALRMRLKR